MTVVVVVVMIIMTLVIAIMLISNWVEEIFVTDILPYRTNNCFSLSITATRALQVLRRVVRDVFVPEHYPHSIARMFDW